MGSSNVTCFASQQTINEGDRCFVIPLLQSSSLEEFKGNHRGAEFSAYGIANSNSYIDSFWEPMTTPIEAYYVDYGRFNLVNSPENYRNLESFLSRLAGGSPRAKSLRDFMLKEAPTAAAHFYGRSKPDEAGPSFDVLAKCWKHVYAEMSDYQLFCANTYPGTPRPVAVAALHGDTFDTLVQMAEADPDHKGNSMGMLDFLQRAKQETLEAGMPSFMRNEDQEGRDYFLLSGVWDMLKYVGNHQGHQYPGEEGYRSALFKLGPLSDISAEQMLKVLRPMLTPRYALRTLDKLNLRFTPLVDAGQDYDNDIGKQYAKFVALVSKKVCRSQAEVRYGPFETYEFTLRRPYRFKPELLEKVVGPWDAELNILGLFPDSAYGEPAKVLRVECTLEKERFKELLREFIEANPEAMAEPSTLRQEPTSTVL